MIDSSGKWWRGQNFSDLKEYLRRLCESDQRLDTIVRSLCSCGNVYFNLIFEANEGVAKRICSACKKEQFICDSGEYWDDVSSKTNQLKCISCKNTEHMIAVGFELRPGWFRRDVRWITVGALCKKCGILSSPLDWKIDWGPSHHLVRQA